MFSRRVFIGWAIPLIAVIILFLSLGCSGGELGPVTPPSQDEPGPGPDTPLTSAPRAHNLFGFAGLKFDADSNAYTINRNKTVELHYNLTDPMSEPLCPDCIEIETVAVDEINHMVELLITLRNPTANTYYDVRGLAVTNKPFIKLIDPDGYITLFDDGGDIEWNPFYSYSLEKIDRSFIPNDVTQRTWFINYTPGESMDFILVVEGSAPGHCSDVTRVLTGMSDDALLTPWRQSGAFQVVADDWQSDVETVRLCIPGISVNTVLDPNGENYTWPLADFGSRIGDDYEYYVEAISPNPDSIAVRQYGTLTVEPDEEYFYADSAGGYPMKGLNPTRDNRSPYVGPINLQNSEEIGLYGFKSPFTYPHNDSITDIIVLRIDESNTYYYGLEWGNVSYAGTGYTSCYEDCVHRMKVNGKGLGKRYGGRRMVLTKDRVLTYHKSSSSSYSYQWPDPFPHYSCGGSSYFIYSSDLNFNDEVSYGGTSSSYYCSEYPEIYDWLPLPDRRFLSLETIHYADWLEFPTRVALRDIHTLEPLATFDIFWSYSARPTGAAAGADGRIYFVVDGPKNNRIVCTDMQLSMLWENPIGNPLNAPAISGKGNVFVGTDSGVYAFAPDGAQLWLNDVIPFSAFAVNSHGNLVFVSSTGSELVCLDGGDGSIMWGSPVVYNNLTKGIIVDAEDKIYLGTDKRLYIFDSSGVELDSIRAYIHIFPNNDWTHLTNIVLGSDGVLSQVWKRDYEHKLMRFS